MKLSQTRIPLENDLDVACAVMHARKLARELGFDEIAQCKIGTVISELGHNIVKYAGCGWMNIRYLNSCIGKGLEICAEDCGPGIPDLAQALHDHYSTGGSLGLGLPGVKRLMDDFVVQSEPHLGTKVTVRKWL